MTSLSSTTTDQLPCWTCSISNQVFPPRNFLTSYKTSDQDSISCALTLNCRECRVPSLLWSMPWVRMVSNSWYGCVAGWINLLPCLVFCSNVTPKERSWGRKSHQRRSSSHFICEFTYSLTWKVDTRVMKCGILVKHITLSVCEITMPWPRNSWIVCCTLREMGGKTHTFWFDWGPAGEPVVVGVQSLAQKPLPYKVNGVFEVIVFCLRKSVLLDVDVFCIRWLLFCFASIFRK